MTSHELAKKLLDMPDLPVVVQDGMDPSDLKVLEHIRLSNGGDMYYTNSLQADGLKDGDPYISLE